MIAAFSTYTVCNSGLIDVGDCDEVKSYPSVSFNGDDAYALITGSDYAAATAADIVDQVGIFSEADVGSAWPVSAGQNSDMNGMNEMGDKCTKD